MRKTILAAAVLGAIAAPSVVFAEEAASPLSFNVGLVSDYLFRGISQTHGKPAVQGGIDYAHPSGLYVGAWGSNVTWVKDWLGKGSVEVDLYGGYKGTAGDIGYDVGFIAYNYPGHGDASPTWLANPNTQEIYTSISYKWLSAKYSYATSSHFVGWYGGDDYLGNSRGSDYLELNANYDMGNGWTLIGHVGRQKIKGFSTVAYDGHSASYTDWKLGASKDIGFGVVSLYYSDTNTGGSCGGSGGTNPYCWGTGGKNPNGPTGNFRDVSKGTAVVTFLKTF